jgi:hypothetical protein
MLHQRISEAEIKAASATERERLASERAQALATRVSGVDAVLQAGRDEVRSLQTELEAALQRCGLADDRGRVAAQQLELMQERLVLAGRQAEEVRAVCGGEGACGSHGVSGCEEENTQLVACLLSQGRLFASCYILFLTAIS